MNYRDDALSIDNQELVTLIKNVFDSDGQFKLLVTGNSMLPFIRHLRDSVILVHPSKRIPKHKDIVLIKRTSNQLVLHASLS